MRTNPRSSTSLVLNAAAVQAIKAFRRSKPWRGDQIERTAKMSNLHQALCRAYDMETILQVNESTFIEGATSGRSAFDAMNNRIILCGKLSVVTYFFCFAASHGLPGWHSVEWAKATFRQYFPRSARRNLRRQSPRINPESN